MGPFWGLLFPLYGVLFGPFWGPLWVLFGIPSSPFLGSPWESPKRTSSPIPPPYGAALWGCGWRWEEKGKRNPTAPKPHSPKTPQPPHFPFIRGAGGGDLGFWVPLCALWGWMHWLWGGAVGWGCGVGCGCAVPAVPTAVLPAGRAVPHQPHGDDDGLRLPLRERRAVVQQYGQTDPPCQRQGGPPAWPRCGPIASPLRPYSVPTASL